MNSSTRGSLKPDEHVDAVYTPSHHSAKESGKLLGNLDVTVYTGCSGCSDRDDSICHSNTEAGKAPDEYADHIAEAPDVSGNTDQR